MLDGWVDRLAREVPTGRRDRVLAAGVAFGASAAAVAFLVTLVVGVMTVSPTYVDPATVAFVVGLPVAAGLGAAVVAAPLWWLVVERGGGPARVRCGVVGVAVAVLAHPLMWLFAGLGVGVVQLATTGVPPPSELTLDFVGAALAGFFAVTVAGQVLTGVVTVPAGAAVGVLLADVHERAIERAGARRDHL